MIISETVKSGVVVSTSGMHARVKINCDDDRCHDCKMSHLCPTTSYTPTLHAKIESGLDVKEGDHVLLTGRVKGWMKGWALLAGLPCLAILSGLILGSLWELKDGAAGAMALGFVVIYYLLLWTFRGKVDKNVEWIVESVKGD